MLETPSSPALVPPRGAAVSGVIFAVLMMLGLSLVRYVIPADLKTPGAWIIEPRNRNAVLLALKLVSFAGIAFLWFIGVLRNRLAELEDRLFATVFLGSGLLFVASLFGAAAVTDARVQSVGAADISSGIYYFGRTMGDALLNLFAMKMGGSVHVLDLHDRIAHRDSLAISGIYGICLRFAAIIGYLQLEMGHARVSDLDAAGQSRFFCWWNCVRARPAQ
jgi:hypothetical protein